MLVGNPATLIKTDWPQVDRSGTYSTSKLPYFLGQAETCFVDTVVRSVQVTQAEWRWRPHLLSMLHTSDALNCHCRRHLRGPGRVPLPWFLHWWVTYPPHRHLPVQNGYFAFSHRCFWEDSIFFLRNLWLPARWGSTIPIIQAHPYRFQVRISQ